MSERTISERLNPRVGVDLNPVLFRMMRKNMKIKERVKSQGAMPAGKDESSILKYCPQRSASLAGRSSRSPRMVDWPRKAEIKIRVIWKRCLISNKSWGVRVSKKPKRNF